jgi:hypothetical protein
LLGSPRTKSFDKLESKWVGPYVVTEKTRPMAYHLVNPKEKSWSIHGTPTTFVDFMFEHFVRMKVSYIINEHSS